MSTETADPVVTLTPAAVRQARVRLERAGVPGACVRLSVRGGGCSGLSYAIDIADEPKPTDLVSEFDGLRVLVDPKSARFLSGATLDYSLKNLLEGGWVWTNPNADRSCGCGTSFSPRF